MTMLHGVFTFSNAGTPLDFVSMRKGKLKALGRVTSSVRFWPGTHPSAQGSQLGTNCAALSQVEAL